MSSHFMTLFKVLSQIASCGKELHSLIRHFVKSISFDWFETLLLFVALLLNCHAGKLEVFRLLFFYLFNSDLFLNERKTQTTKPSLFYALMFRNAFHMSIISFTLSNTSSAASPFTRNDQPGTSYSK